MPVLLILMKHTVISVDEGTTFAIILDVRVAQKMVSYNLMLF